MEPNGLAATRKSSERATSTDASRRFRSGETLRRGIKLTKILRRTHIKEVGSVSYHPSGCAKPSLSRALVARFTCVSLSGLTWPFVSLMSSPIWNAACRRSRGRRVRKWCLRFRRSNCRGQVVRLEFEAHRGVVVIRANAGADAEQMLHMMADFMGDHIGAGELAKGASTSPFHLGEEREVGLHKPRCRRGSRMARRRHRRARMPTDVRRSTSFGSR